MRTFRYLALAATVLAATVAVSPAGATCYGDSCDEDPVTETDLVADVPVNMPHVGAIDGDWVSAPNGVPNGVGLGGWTTASHVRVSINGFFVMNLPTQRSSTGPSRFTVFLPVYPWPDDREVCVHALDAPWSPPGTRLGCVSQFTWWL